MTLAADTLDTGARKTKASRQQQQGGNRSCDYFTCLGIFEREGNGRLHRPTERNRRIQTLPVEIVVSEFSKGRYTVHYVKSTWESDRCSLLSQRRFVFFVGNGTELSCLNRPKRVP